MTEMYIFVLKAGVDESRPFNPFSETCVRVLSTPVRRYQAKAECEDNGQRMIELHSYQLAEWFSLLHNECKFIYTTSIDINII